MTLDELLKLPEELLESAWKAVEERRRQRYVSTADAVKARIVRAERGAGDFTDEQLVYAAGQRCLCGAGMAYPEGIGMHGAWHCSAILKGRAAPDTTHTGAMPFMFWSVRSEDQIARNNGYVTTRPSGTPLPAHTREAFVRENERRRDHQPSSPQLEIPEVTP